MTICDNLKRFWHKKDSWSFVPDAPLHLSSCLLSSYLIIPLTVSLRYSMFSPPLCYQGGSDGMLPSLLWTRCHSWGIFASGRANSSRTSNVPLFSPLFLTALGSHLPAEICRVLRHELVPPSLIFISEYRQSLNSRYFAQWPLFAAAFLWVRYPSHSLSFKEPRLLI